MSDTLNIKQSITKFLLNISIFCAFLAIISLSLDQFPWLQHTGLPQNLSLTISAIGIFFYGLSFTWIDSIKKHLPLLCLTLALCLSMLISTLLGMQEHPSLGVWPLLRYIKWFILPFVILVWLALLFSHIPKEQGQKIFLWGIGILFLTNAVHMCSEILANAGFASIKDTLITINPYFRNQLLDGSWWPPVFWSEGRIRGLFAEPSHLAVACLPMIGYAVYSYWNTRKKYGLLVAIFLTYCVVKSVTLTGFIGLVSAFLAGSGLILARRYSCKRALIQISIICCISTGALLFAIHDRPVFDRIKNLVPAISFISEKIRQEDTTQTLEKIIYTTEPKLFTRLCVMWIDVEMGAQSFLGQGYSLRGEYWPALKFYSEPLTAELQSWINATPEGFPTAIPSLSTYTSLMAEGGIPALALFAALLFYILRRAALYYMTQNDMFVFFSTAIYCGLCAALISANISSATVFFLFSGFLYATTRPEGNEN